MSEKPSKYYVIPEHNVLTMMSYLPDYLTLKKVYKKGFLYRCVESKHKDTNPSMGLFIGKDGKLRVTCQGCGATYDLFNLIRKFERIYSFKDQYYYACKLFNQDPKFPLPSTYYEHLKKADHNTPDYLSYVEACKNNSLKYEKWEIRNISKSIIDSFNLGYDAALDALVIPISKKGYVQRFFNKTPKYNRSRGLRECFYAIRDPNRFPIIITESEIDALSLLNLGYPNVLALGGVNRLNAFYSSTYNPEKPALPFSYKKIVLALDRDNTGIKTYKKAVAKAEENQYPLPHNFWDFIQENLKNNIKDINDLLRKNTTLLNNTLATIKKESIQW